MADDLGHGSGLHADDSENKPPTTKSKKKLFIVAVVAIAVAVGLATSNGSVSPYCQHAMDTSDASLSLQEMAGAMALAAQHAPTSELSRGWRYLYETNSGGPPVDSHGPEASRLAQMALDSARACHEQYLHLRR